MAPVLGYLNIRGLAQPIRLMLEEAGAEYEEKRYNYSPAPSYEKTEWLQEKNNLGLAFPNVPYWIDGDLKISQSLAVMRYLARKYDLMGQTEEECVRVDMIEQEMVDMRNAMMKMCYIMIDGKWVKDKEGFEKAKAAYLPNLATKLKAVSDFLGTNPYFAGQRITYVDFLVYEVLDQHKCLESTCLDPFPNLKEFCTRIESRPLISQYMKSDRFIRWPLNGDQATFGSRFDPAP